MRLKGENLGRAPLERGRRLGGLQDSFPSVLVPRAGGCLQGDWQLFVSAPPSLPAGPPSTPPSSPSAPAPALRLAFSLPACLPARGKREPAERHGDTGTSSGGPGSSSFALSHLPVRTCRVSLYRPLGPFSASPFAPSRLAGNMWAKGEGRVLKLNRREELMKLWPCGGGVDTGRWWMSELARSA